jgi:hypothetical protein
MQRQLRILAIGPFSSVLAPGRTLPLGLAAFSSEMLPHATRLEPSVFTSALKANICTLPGGNNADDPVAFLYFGQRLGGVTRDRCVLDTE